MLTPRLADSVTPRLIPETFRVKPNGVAAYINGLYEWPETEIESFPRHWRISVFGDPKWAQFAKVLDVERGDATPADVPAYHAKRRDQGGFLFTYCDRSTVPLICKADPEWANLLWWIATLDNVAWKPEVLSNMIRAEYGVALNPASIRAVQCYPFGHYDMSLMYGDPRW